VHNGRHVSVTITAAAQDSSLGSPTPTGASGLVAWYAEGFSDRFGDRLLLFDNSGSALELLRFSPVFTAHAGFEAAVRRRVEQLADFRHAAFAEIRSLTILDDPTPQLALVSELVRGDRLSMLLRTAERAGLRPDPGSAVWLLRQLLPPVADLHEAGNGLAHGILGPDRVIVTREGRFAISEYALGGGVETLGLSPSELWQQLGVATRERRGRPILDPTNDVAQVALLAVSVLLGRTLRADEYPVRLSTLDQALGAWTSSLALRGWLIRALGVESSFRTAREALAVLDEFVPGVRGAWSSRLLPDATTAGEAQSSTAPLALAPRDATALATRSRSARTVVDVAPAARRAPLALPGDVAVTRHLWKINGVLTVIAVVETICLATLIHRYGTTGVELPFLTAPPAQTQPAAALSATVSPTDEAIAAATAARPARSSTAGAYRSAAGWVLVNSDEDITAYVNGRLLGSGKHERYRLPAGVHMITLVNDETGVRSRQAVQVTAGRTVLIGTTSAAQTFPPD
jgi:hypothetical protein